MYTIRNIIGPANFPCAIFFFLANLIGVFTSVTIGARLLSLYLRIKFNRKLLKSTFNTLQQGTLMFSVGEETFKPVREGSKESTIDVPEVYNDELNVLQTKPQPRISDANNLSWWFMFCQYVCCAKEVDILPRNVQVAYFLAASFHYKLHIIICSIYILSSSCQTFNDVPLKCTGCRLADVSGYVIVPILVLVLWIIVLYCLLRKHKDPLGIKTKWQ